MIDGLKDAPAGAGIAGFEFVDAGRTFTCSVEAPRAARPEGWWWFRVTPDVRDQRYAPFRASADDTRDGVRTRIVAYYDDLLARRAMPSTNTPWARRRPGVPGAVPAQPVPADGTPGDTPLV
jgi:hypothetical protein